MSRVLACLGVLVFFCSPALAGPNSDGAIIVHTNDNYTYSSSDPPCTTPLGSPPSCEEAITRSDLSRSVVWFLAAFPPGSNPAISAIYFGVDFDASSPDGGAYGHCGPSGTLEIPDPGWPDNDAGNSLGLGTPIVGETLFRFYYFVVDELTGTVGPYFCSGINPTGGYASFFDNSLPPLEDGITQFGCVRWYQAGSNTCPQVQPLAACCNPTTGACYLTTHSSCLPPDIWNPDWSSCVPNPCPQPRAVCCYPDGTCQVILEADCLPPGAWHLFWLSCSPNPCPQPLGACCNPATGQCLMRIQADCLPTWIWHPEWTECVPNPCPQPPIGVCCAPDASCVLTTEVNCGPPRVWHPEWTTCTPNPCPVPVGACCAPDASCTLTTEDGCLAPSQWQGAGSDCTPNPCPLLYRACCAPDGTCALRSQADCQPPSVWHLEWLSCTPNPCPTPMGACCNPLTGDCTLVVASQCPEPFVWHFEWTTCDPNPCPLPYGPNVNGAIIVHTKDAYVYSAGTVCTTTLGQPAACSEAVTRTDRSTGSTVWFLAAFEPTASPVVASIYFGISYDESNLDPTVQFGFCGPPGTVEVVDPGWPSNNSGNSLGFGSPIAGNTLFPFYYFVVDESSGGPGPFLCSAVNPTGGYAAFFDDRFPPVEDQIERFGCVRWYQEGQNSCPGPPVMGACCDLVTGTCIMTTSYGCPDPWVWLGEGTICNPNPCPAPIGACCFVNGECEVLTEAGCLAAYGHLSWLGPGTSCSPDNPCPAPGACCDPADGSCWYLVGQACTYPRVWLGVGVECWPDNPCLEPAACCSPYGECTFVGIIDCQPPSYWMPGMTCEENPCSPPTPIQRTTWGRIKAGFR